MMLKRLLAGMLLTLGLSVAALGLLAGPAMASSTGNGTTNAATMADGYTSTPPTDPCLTGNGTTATTNGNCYPATTPNSGTAPNSGNTAGSGTSGASSATGTASALGSTTATGTDNGSLAFTGTDIVGTVIVALVLIGGGLVLLRASRRKHTA